MCLEEDGGGGKERVGSEEAKREREERERKREGKRGEEQQLGCKDQRGPPC